MPVRPSTPWPWAAAAGLILTLGCSGSAETAPASAPAPREVHVVRAKPSDVALTAELPGRVAASRVAEVRARAAGILLERRFQEGSDVREGEVLYRIDPAPLRAAEQVARANLARAEAVLQQVQARASRLERLRDSPAASALEVDEALAARALAEADVAAAKAALTNATLNLDYATVRAPISGRIGRSEVTEGALVGQGTATWLATIQQLDPVYVDLTDTSAELSALRRAVAAGRLGALDGPALEVTVLRDDGTPYPHPGALLFTDVSVDPSTGAVRVRAEVPNPDGELLPGAFVRARVPRALASQAITVPQQAVTRTTRGAHVLVVDEAGTVAQRPISVGGAVGNDWQVTEGLAAGELVIVEGLARTRPGATVTTKVVE